MSESFDPYRKWLGIQAEDWPPTHYRLLGISPDEHDPDVINAALLRNSAYVRNFQTGQYAEQANQILNELSVAAICLSDPAKRAAYDRSLRPAMPPPGAAHPSRPVATPAHVSPGRMAPVAPPPAPPPVVPHHPGPPLDPLMALSQVSAFELNSRPQSAFFEQPQPKKQGLSGWVWMSGLGASVVVAALLVMGMISALRGASRRPDAVDSTSTLTSSSVNDQLNPQAPVTSESVKTSDSVSAGQESDDNGLKMKFCWCPPGTFMMGAPDSDKDATNHEKPQVKVTLSRGFWLGKHEVTQGQWQAVMGNEPWRGQKNTGEGVDFAASFVGWEDAAQFCSKLTISERKTGRLNASEEYRLPTEAEWEYACRAGTKTRYNFGDDAGMLDEYAWWGGEVGNGNAKSEQYAHQVGLKKPNAWGLYDVHGNVWEWCSGWYSSKLAGGRDPPGSSQDSFRVVRGGGWQNLAAHCRSSHRVRYSPLNRHSLMGFRVALGPSSK